MLLSLVSINRYSPSILCLSPASSVIPRKEADFSIMGKGTLEMCLFVNIIGYRLNMLWFWDKRLLLLSLNFISLCLAPSITHSAFSDVFFPPVFSDKSRSVYHCVSSQLTKPGLTLGGGGGGMEAEHYFFWMTLWHSNNPKRELLKCSPYSVCHQKILGLSTCHRQLHKMNEEAKIHGYSSTSFQSRQIRYLLSVQEKKQSLSLHVWEGEGWQREACSPCCCRKPGSTSGSPRYLPRGDCYCRVGHWGLNAAASWAALNHCTSARKMKGFQILLFSEKLQNKVDISVEVNGTKIIRNFHQIKLNFNKNSQNINIWNSI